MKRKKKVVMIHKRVSCVPNCVHKGRHTILFVAFATVFFFRMLKQQRRRFTKKEKCQATKSAPDPARPEGSGSTLQCHTGCPVAVAVVAEAAGSILAVGARIAVAGAAGPPQL